MLKVLLLLKVKCVSQKFLLNVSLFSFCSFTENTSLALALEEISIYTQNQKQNKQRPIFPKIVQKITKRK